MVAAKFLDDFYYSNKHWAEIGGISTKELNNLELEFLFRTSFGLVVTREEYDWHASQLIAQDMEAAAATAAAAAAAASPCMAMAIGDVGPVMGAGAGAPPKGGGYADEGPKVPSYCNIADASAAFALSAGRDAMVVD